MFTTFNRFEIQMTRKQALACSHQGDCADDVNALIKSKQISRPRKCTPENLKKELSEYGAWEENELENDTTNWERIVWLAAGNIKEDLHERRKSNLK
jgi:hypothetical protein